jgi:urease accessory protein
MTEAALLTLVQWLSPAFPVGSFAYSHGLEEAVAEGHVRSAADLRDWLGDVLERGAGRGDAILLVHALKPGADQVALAALARALATSRERLVETEAQGAALLATTNALTGTAHGPMPYPVALGAAAAPLGLPAQRVAALYLQAFATALTQAGVRFIPLGQTEGQGVLAALSPLILLIAEEAALAPLDAIGSSATGADLAAMRHETMETRIFRT